MIVSGGHDGTVRLWDMESGETVAEPQRGHDDWVNALAVGERSGLAVIVSGGSDGMVRLWDLESGYAVGEPLRDREGWAITLTLGERAGTAR